MVHSNVTRGSDGPSCFEVLVAGSFLESYVVPTLIWHLVLSSAYNAHLKRTAWGSGCASSHCGAKASHCCISTIWIHLFAWTNKVVVFWWIFGRSLSRIKGAILRKRTNQVIVFDKWTLASLRFWLWNLRAIFWRNLSCYSMGCPHCNTDAPILTLKWSCRSSSLRNWWLLFSLLLICYLRRVNHLVITLQVIRLSTQAWTFRCISKYDVLSLNNLWHTSSNPRLLSPSEGLWHWMLIKFVCLIFISTPKHTISLVDYFVRLQLFLDVRKVGYIELFFWSTRLIFRMGVKWNSLLHLRLKLCRRLILILIVIYILNNLVVSSRQLICVYCIVNVSDVLRSLASRGLRGLLVRLKL